MCVNACVKACVCVGMCACVCEPAAAEDSEIGQLGFKVERC